ncbi:MAG: hypothetical protein KGQ37_09410 [Hyphomicrobiales bacterium]|nr:hypothetical protein [Hyphomicrobiales bacterium]
MTDYQHINRDAFLAAVVRTIGHGRLREHQIAGFDEIVPEWAIASGMVWSLGSRRQLAYVLATIWHETAFTMQPIAEYGHGHGHAYGEVNHVTGHAYYGRGYVQLTWLRNYRDFSPLVGCDLVHDPDAALEPAIAARIAVLGMLNGMFTGRRLRDFITDNRCNFLEARTIINGHDRAAIIAMYASHFDAALETAEAAMPAPTPPATA